MIFGPIACFRRSGSRFSGQKTIPGPKKEKNEQTLGHIKNHEKIVFFTLVPGIRKIDFYDFSGIFLRKDGT